MPLTHDTSDVSQGLFQTMERRVGAFYGLRVVLIGTEAPMDSL